jgi:hypothetical protein
MLFGLSLRVLHFPFKFSCCTLTLPFTTSAVAVFSCRCTESRFHRQSMWTKGVRLVRERLTAGRTKSVKPSKRATSATASTITRTPRCGDRTRSSPKCSTSQSTTTTLQAATRSQVLPCTSSTQFDTSQPTQFDYACVSFDCVLEPAHLYAQWRSHVCDPFRLHSPSTVLFGWWRTVGNSSLGNCR